MADVIHINWPWWKLLLMFALLPAIVAITVALLRRVAHNITTPGEERDWSVPVLTDAPGRSIFHGWDVRCKIVTILLFCFAIASLEQLKAALVAICFSFLALIIARVSIVRVVMRLLAICGFITMFMVIMPFSVPAHSEDTVFVLNNMEWLGFNLRGLHVAATIAAKAVAVTLLMEPLISTAPLPVTLHGLSRLGVPEMVGQMILLSYRYLHVFRHEARRISWGMKVRGFRKRTDLETLRAVANFLGMLFVRSFERTERVFDAMQARGYRGCFPDPVELRMKPMDLMLSVVWLLAGTALVISDRMFFY